MFVDEVFGIRCTSTHKTQSKLTNRYELIAESTYKQVHAKENTELKINCVKEKIVFLLEKSYVEEF